MSTPFNPQRGLIVVRGALTGSKGNAPARLAIDTGATRTLVRPQVLIAAGYDPTTVPATATATTASGTVPVPRIAVLKIEALGHDRLHFPVLVHPLPANVPADGLLGLDFFRGLTLTLDFRTGQISLV